MVAMLKVHCDVCATMRTFDQPVCVDSHGAECPDWACTTCGSAIFLAPPVMLVDRRTPVLLRRPVRPSARRDAA